MFCCMPFHSMQTERPASIKDNPIPMRKYTADPASWENCCKRRRGQLPFSCRSLWDSLFQLMQRYFPAEPICRWILNYPLPALPTVCSKRIAGLSSLVQRCNRSFRIVPIRRCLFWRKSIGMQCHTLHHIKQTAGMSIF